MFRALPLVMDFDLGRGSEFFGLEIGGSCYYGGFRVWVMGGGLTSIGLKEGDHEQARPTVVFIIQYIPTKESFVPQHALGGNLMNYPRERAA